MYGSSVCDDNVAEAYAALWHCIKESYVYLTYGGRRRGSVVRTSIFGWQTFPDLRLIYG